MKKLILITCLFSVTLLGDGIDSTQYKFTIYPELVGLGGLPSINIEYLIEDYSIKEWDWNDCYGSKHLPYCYI